MMIMDLANPAHSDEAQCRDVLHKCDDALKAEQAVNATQKQIIDSLTTVTQLQAKQLDSQSIWKPIALGAGTAVIIETLIIIFKK